MMNTRRQARLKQIQDELQKIEKALRAGKLTEEQTRNHNMKKKRLQQELMMVKRAS